MHIMIDDDSICYRTRLPELWAIKVYIARIGILDVFGSCDLDLDPMTSDVHILTRVVLAGDTRDVRI